MEFYLNCHINLHGLHLQQLKVLSQLAAIAVPPINSKVKHINNILI